VLGGTTAAQLGIARPTLAPGPIDGADLNPVLRSTTRLDDLLGGAAWDRASGLRIDNAGQTYLIDLGTAETVEDLLNAFNSSGAQVVAEINRRGDGINVRSRLSGADFSIGENGGSTATDLGLRSLIAATPLPQLNHRQGVDAVAGTDFIIRRRDGVELAVDVSSARTVEDVINLINQHGDNLDPGTAVLARLATVGNGIELVDQNPVEVQPLAVRRVNGSRAAWDLGLVTWGEETSTPADPVSPPGTGERMIGSDVNPLETQGVFNTLIRLHDAILRGDAGEIERVTAMLDDDLDRLSFGRAEVGVRTRSLDALAARNADEQVELQTVLSDTIDVDMAQAVSEFLARQAAYEASLRTMAGMLRMSLLDFL
jgi:flagellar hook-associated protein 3 FlgL